MDGQQRRRAPVGITGSIGVESIQSGYKFVVALFSVHYLCQLPYIGKLCEINISPVSRSAQPGPVLHF